MEKESVRLFRMKNRWGLTALAVALCLLGSPFASMGLFMPQFLMMLPVLILVLLGFVGPVSAVACSAVLVGLCGTLYGLAGGAAMALLIAPVLIVSTVLVERRTGFFLSAGICAAVMFASMGVILAMLSLAAKTDVVTALTQLVGSVFSGMGEMADPILLMFAQMGALSLPDGVLSFQDLAENFRLTSAQREEMIASLAYMLNVGLRLVLPMQITVGALSAGVLGQAALRRGVLSRGMEVPYTPLRKWRLPSGWGRVLGVTFAALFVAAQLLPERLSVMAYVFSGVFMELFALQGIAAFSYKLHESGRGKRWAALVFVIGYFVARPAAMILGIADQAFDFTHRRKALDTEDNPYDPRARM